ncbi:hypothetical protein [Salmonirosea aquatica]|uniref:Uncharacterized protein n=1 Tax=Salmonirosea aquatica TaxID=2654236 RepID=A0A7C9BP12_9BACT|nr:hypothetical protein [Cytophagaceae bacterium SJW1-29]
MKPYSEYSAEELAMERLFIRWVMAPDDPPIKKFWMGWIEKHPHMEDTVREADALVRTASDWNLEGVSAQESGSLWSRIRTTIETLPEMEHLEPSLKAMATNWYFLRWSAGIAATVVLVLLWFFWEPSVFHGRSNETNIAKSDTTRVMERPDSTKKNIPFKIK